MKSLLSSLLVVAGSSFFSPHLLHAAPMNARPNVLMIAIDDLNDYISVLQNPPGIKTPNFDRLAARGINFTRAYCAAPLCNPSRVALITGMAPNQTGVYQLSDLISKSAPAMAAVALEEQFKRHGYDTYLTGKYYHAGEDHWWPKERLDAMWTERQEPFSDHGPKTGTNGGWKEVMQAYLACISFADWVVGQILDSLDASPYAKNTIVVLWSDNGYHFGEKEHLHKRALWSQTSRIPFMISVPGMATAGESCAAPVSLLDIYPTLNELCDLDQKVPQKLAGHSLAPLLKDPGQAWPWAVVTSHDVGNAAVTDARHHYIRYADGAEELYDHQKDPREYANLAPQPESKPVIQRLAASLPQSWVPAHRKKGGKGGGAED